MLTSLGHPILVSAWIFETLKHQANTNSQSSPGVIPETNSVDAPEKEYQSQKERHQFPPQRVRFLR